jgi:hypothetical protein
VMMMGDATGSGVSQLAGHVILKLMSSLAEYLMSSELAPGTRTVPYGLLRLILCTSIAYAVKHVLIYRFYLNETSVSQCNPVEVYWDATAVSPVRVIGVIPQGQIFEFSSIGAATSMSKSHPSGEELTKQPGIQTSLLVPLLYSPHSILDPLEMEVPQP